MFSRPGMLPRTMSVTVAQQQSRSELTPCPQLLLSLRAVQMTQVWAVTLPHGRAVPSSPALRVDGLSSHHEHGIVVPDIMGLKELTLLLV